MAEVGAFQARTHLSHLLDRVERGETIIITRHRKQVVAQLKALREGQTLGGLSLRELIDEGRQ